MARMGINEEMYNFFMLLDDDEKKLVLEKVKELVREKTSGTNRIGIEQYNKEIEEAEREIEAGNFIAHGDLLEEMKSW